MGQPGSGGSPLGGGGGSTGAPTTGGRGRGGGGDDGRLTRITWWEADLGKIRVVTPRDGEKQQSPEASEDDEVRKAFKMSAWDPKPTLLYFHYEHEDPNVGKATERQCKLLDDETVARWSALFHCVEVDMNHSDIERLARFGAGETPSFAVVNQDLEVVAKSDAVGNSKQAAAFLRRTVQEGFPEYWKQVEAQIAEHRKLIAEAGQLSRKKETRKAYDTLQIVLFSGIRISSEWEKALELSEKIAKELDE